MSYLGIYWLFGIPFFIAAYVYHYVKIEKKDVNAFDLMIMILVSIFPILREFTLILLYHEKLLTYPLIKARK